MKQTIKIAAFGALNQASYDIFEKWLAHYADKYGVHSTVKSGGPYPNAEAVTVPGRPLRGDALKDPALMEELYQAVVEDARKLGGDFDYYCMPCMSMIGFHDGVEKLLGHPIVPLADALRNFYKNIDKVGVIHMRPATKRIAEIFGDRAVRPTKKQAAALLAAEEQAKKDKNPAPVESEMKKIVESFRDRGLTHVLFARADAPQADYGAAAQVDGIQTNSYFEILAKTILDKAQS